MRQMKRTGLTLAVLVLLLGSSESNAKAEFIDSVNATDSPASISYNTATDIGWYYKPSFSYVLGGIETIFGSPTDGRTVTVEIFSGTPTAAGPLREASFIPSGGSFEGATFAPLDLVAGQTYFIGFENISHFPVNVTQDSGATSLGSAHWDTDHSNLFNGGSDPAGYFTSQPILGFASAVPEPSTLPLFSIGIAGIAGYGWRRRRQSS